MGVIELHRPVVGEALHRDAALVEAAQHVLQGTAHEEGLLLQPQALARIGAVVGIEHLGDGFAVHLLRHGPAVVAVVEGVEVEGLGSLRAPQTQPPAAVHPVAEHRHVMGDAHHRLGGMPAPVHPPAGIGVAGEAAAEAHPAALVRLGDLPGPAALEPLVGDLHLPAVLDQLVEDAELVADAIAHRRDLQAGQRLQEAGRQPAQAAVAQAGLLLHRQDLLDVAHAEAAEGLTGRIADAQHQQVVAQLGTDQELG